ncbi:hypothetical protein L873DRAFT_1825813 [Choiromyces venosus 120613-1]|uniref:RFX-type winged-helix domain-containing protein n=1 Tax=Choiromyces venosus 120613-1 TaxID=1336337 RepID=A0A3N4K0W3_9PEZI|nr:hypothetical protein L873DRAFT_1825813 [Choiromyces venosus 120613-1]
MNGNTLNFPSFQSSSINAPIGRPVATPQNAPHKFVNHKRRVAEVLISSPNRHGAGHQGAALMVRISMGLKSGIPSEAYPGLSEALFEKLATIQSLANTCYPEGAGELLEDSKFVKQLEKINEAALVLRNMLLQPDNARYFSRLKSGRQIIVACMNLPGQSCFIELKHYILDMVEAMIHFSLAVDDDFSGSLRAICRLVMGRNEANCIGQINKLAIDRIKALIMLEDEDLVSACLDFLYQYTTNEENMEKLIQLPDGIEIVKQLTRLLLHQTVPGDQVMYLTGSLKPIIKTTVIPNLPQEIEDSTADITQIALWQAYQARFTEYVATSRPLLPAAEFIKNVSVAFNNASEMVLSIPGGSQKFIIKGIKPRETPMSVKGQVYLACKWATATNSNNTTGTETPQAQQQPAQPTKCPAQLATPHDLWVHILKDHLSPPDPTQQPQAKLLCDWGGCERFHPAGDSDRRKVIAHVRTHMPEPSPPKNSNPSSRQNDWLDDPKQIKLVIRRNQTGIDDHGEAAGIPLTAVLVLRNVARRGMFNGKELLSGERPVLFEIMAVNKPLSNYIADLLVEEDEGVTDD